MDDDSFKTELLSRLDRIQALLTYLCGAAKATESRAKAGDSTKLPISPADTVSAEKAVMSGAPAESARTTQQESDSQEAPLRVLIQEEMEDDYSVALRKWKAGKL